MDAKKEYLRWMEKLGEDDPLKKELSAISGDDGEITERFYQEIVFGTAGLRGICGAGTNRMNVLTVGRATQGIADYILASGEDPKRGVAIAYDCRYHSQEFSELVAGIMAGNGIRAFLFPSMRPTPELSFAIRKLGCVSGVNMTASHNPKEYNGYKVYWSDGAQISGEISDGMLACIQKLDFFDLFKCMPLEEAKKEGLVVMIGEEMDRAYLDYVKSMSQHGPDELDLSVRVVYTPLNGAGAIPVRTVLTEMGYTDFHIVPEQEMPDPEFTTVGYPNPEDPRGFALAEKLFNEFADKDSGFLTSGTYDQQILGFASGKYAFVTQGSWIGATMTTDDAAQYAEAGNFKVGMIPYAFEEGIDTILTNSPSWWAVFKNDNTDAAKAFLDWLATDEGQEILVKKGGFISPFKSCSFVAEDPFAETISEYTAAGKTSSWHWLKNKSGLDQNATGQLYLEENLNQYFSI